MSNLQSRFTAAAMRLFGSPSRIVRPVRTGAVGDVSGRRRDMAFLGEVGHLFQACHSVQEVCNVARARLQRLSPRLAGVLYLTSADGEYLETAMTWGKIKAPETSFPPDDCWSLRCGRPHLVDRDDGALACAHTDAAKGGWHLCLPLMAQGEAVGVLYLRVLGEVEDSAGDDLTSEDRVHFYITVAESLALAVANIRLRETLQDQAIRDPLTGLFNRRYLLETLRREMHRAERASQPLSLVILDIDHFKKFNDTFGHDGGDAALKVVGNILQGRTRAGDVASRLGGEEFALVFPGMPEDVAVRRVEALRTEIEGAELIHAGQVLDQITISAGLAVYPQHAGGMDALLHAADKALYESKRGGRNRMTVAVLPRRKTDAPAMGVVQGGLADAPRAKGGGA
ncbi:MAG: diguanylate cyclase [Hyphomicrobiales bacterium]